MSLNHGHLFVSGTRIEVFWVHEAEPSFIFDLHGRCATLSSMAVHLPYLPGSPLVSLRFLTSFVPPAHNQGVSLAFLQGHALWRVFLLTTGSFLCNCLLTPASVISAPFGGRIPIVFFRRHLEIRLLYLQRLYSMLAPGWLARSLNIS